MENQESADIKTTCLKNFTGYSFTKLHRNQQKHPEISEKKQGNRLARRPCKGDKFEIMIFEAKGEGAGICGTCQNMFAI